MKRLVLAVAALCLTFSLAADNQGWQGAKVAVIGDSITKARPKPKVIWWEHVARRMGCDVKVFAQSGHRWQEAMEHIDRIAVAMGDDVDAILVFLGTNDFGSSCPLGVWYEEEDGSVNCNGTMRSLRHRRFAFDSKTFRGRINNALARMKRRWPAAQVVLITPTHRGYFKLTETNVAPDESWPNTAGLWFEDYVRCVREAADIWSCPLIDLYSESGLVPLVGEQLGFFNSGNDMLHPNNAGHARMADVICARLANLPAGFRDCGEVRRGVRGLVLSAKDLSGNLDWPRIAHEAGVGTLATHIGPKDVMPFLKSEKGRRFREDCRKYGIAVEHELHAIEYLLPRELFAVEPELFRMNDRGVRTPDANCCASNPRARAIIASNAVEVAKVCRPTTGRYFYWLTDDAPVCACEKCRTLSAADQAVLIENAIVGALRRRIDPNATLSHLAYLKTLEPPRQVKPDPALFLEFAPIRRWDRTTKREDLAEGGAYAQALDGLLAVFPAETAQVLEYWLDESLFCHWTDKRVRIPWDAGRTVRDLTFYARRGIRNYTTFAVSLDDAYVAKFGTNDLDCVKAYSKALKTALRPLPEGVSFVEEKTSGLVRLENRYGRLEVSLKGAQIRSYEPVGVGELLYRPKAMDFSGSTENRGGIPVCWPWFGRNGEPGSQPHGYARHSDFAFGGVRRFDDGTLELTLQLRPTAENLKLWPHEVELDYRIALGPNLVLELETRNVGKESVVITEGVHPYWAVTDRRQVRVDGLDGLRYCFADESTVDDKTWKGTFVPDGHFDHVFRLKNRPIVISDAGNGRRVTLEGTGYSKLVIWTPAPFEDNAFENLPSADMLRFVCVEPATLFRPDAYSLAPGGRHVMCVSISAALQK